jgi:hypothetical protein
MRKCILTLAIAFLLLPICLQAQYLGTVNTHPSHSAFWVQDTNNDSCYLETANGTACDTSKNYDLNMTPKTGLSVQYWIAHTFPDSADSWYTKDSVTLVWDTDSTKFRMWNPTLDLARYWRVIQQGNTGAGWTLTRLYVWRQD